ncbi:uncharacterized protein [Primulina eburnea]|uniref:uncharacterized protein n=1 Tax=Primulina eburnea TaxID=1245227 RepID=UPI003C6BF666
MIWTLYGVFLARCQSIFQKAKALDLQINPAPSENAVKKWTRPATGTSKLNVDACINESLNRYSIGGVLRDCQGKLLLAFGKQITKPLSVVHGELLAIKEGVIMIYEKRFQEVLVASDSVLAVQAVKAIQDDLGYSGICAEEINLLAHAPVISDLVYEPRVTNKVAHQVANFASSSPSPFIWMNGDFPLWLVELVMINDYSS